jgi:hypothetical protein
MTIIIKNASLDTLNKSTEAVAIWMKKYGGRQQVTVEWLSKNGCFVYSAGEKDKETINVR